MKGDWCLLVQDDFVLINEKINENHIMSMKASQYKIYIKYKVRCAVFNILKSLQSTHIKVRDIPYITFSVPQSYMTEKCFTNDECSLLFREGLKKKIQKCGL